MKLQNITIKEYLEGKNIKFREVGKEIITKCLFNDCDKDSKGNKGHLYFNAETGQYECKKCGERGNLITLAKHFGETESKPCKKNAFNAELVEKCHETLPNHVREYLHGRGLTDVVINAYKLGWGTFYGKRWITIPIPDIYGNFSFFKLREDPNTGNNKITYPKGIEAQIYGLDTLASNTEKVVICEGELDRLLLLSKDVPAITSTHGAMTFKEEWIEKIGKDKKIYICFDNDEAGKKGAERIVKMLENMGYETCIITLPEEVGEKGDITDYFIKLNGSVDDLLNKYSKPYPEQIDTSKFKPLSSQELIDILGITIKKDDENKLITFLCELSAYTESSQLNISFNAPSSTGKSYIPTEIAQLFPEDDVMEVGYCSPTAFFHDVGEFSKEKSGYVVDLSRKIMIFLDQPHTLLLQHLRPLLSHDKDEICVKITDKSQKNGLKTKNIYLRGYPAVIFCTAGLKIDEQETTRFLLLSPETNPEKIKEAIYQKIRKEADSDSYNLSLSTDPNRKLLKERIKAIKLTKIKDIKIDFPENIEKAFFTENKKLKPRHQRDIGRIIALTKAFALLNLWFREKNGLTIIANKDDIKEAFKVWNAISDSQELNLPPFVYKIYKEVILPAWIAKNKIGLTRKEITQEHLRVYGRILADWIVRQQIIPMLENSGLITQEQDSNDKRKILIYPTVINQNNSELSGGVKKDEESAISSTMNNL
jgi:5S rRNA maturation endonuclease (ribonuclease M5)